MGPRRQRAEALSKLTDALTCQFGEQARSAVEAQVDMHLSGSSGQIGREHIDVIEKGVLATMRQQRGSTKTNRLSISKSAPFLPLASSPSASQAPTLGASPPPAPSRLTPKLPLGTMDPGSLVRSASAGAVTVPKLTMAPKTKPRRPAPYGLSVTGGNEFVDESARSGVKFQSRYPVPMPPKLKPMDHWDLIVAFDSAKYRQEEQMLHTQGKHEGMMKFKGVLDDQMLEIQASRDNEATGKEEERLLMDAQIEENRKYKQEELDTIHRKRDEQGKVNTSMLGDINKYRDREAQRKQRECEEMTAWLESEKKQREEDEHNQKVEYARKCEASKKNLEEHRQMRIHEKHMEEENEKRLMKIRDQIADEQEAKKQKALQGRKDHLEKIAKTMGAAVADRDAKDAADLAAKIKRIQEESNRRSMEDARNRANTHNAKVKDMVAVRKMQMEEKWEREKGDTREGERQAAKFKQEVEEMNRQESEKLARARKARGDMDASHIAMIRRTAGVHPEHVTMTPRNRKTMLGYNKVIFDQMQREDFRADDVDTLRAMPSRDHHPEGKLLDFPTIPRYTDEIHPIELEAPDV